MAMISSQYYSAVTLICTLICVFVSMRFADLVDVMNNVMCLLLMVLGLVVMTSMYVKPSTTLSYMLRRVFVLVLIYAQLKKTMDSDLTQHLPYRNLQDFRALITIGNGRDDANQIAQALSSMLVMLNCEVVLLCSYADNCFQLVHDVQVKYPNKTSYINAVYLNTTDLEGMKKFSQNFLTKYSRLDYIIHTAKSSNLPVHHYLGHRLIETLLLPLLLTPIPSLAHHNATPAKIVNVLSSSAVNGRFASHVVTLSPDAKTPPASADFWSLTKSTHTFCSTIDTVIRGCNTPEAMMELSSLLYSFELQHRMDAWVDSEVKSSRSPKSSSFRRLIVSSADVGAIHHSSSPSLLEYALSYVSKRDAHDGSMVILHALLKDTYMPASFINSAKNSFDLLDFRQYYLDSHKKIYRGVELKYKRAPAHSLVGFVPFWFMRTNFLSRPSNRIDSDGDSEFNSLSHIATAHRLSQVLYGLTQAALRDFLLPAPGSSRRVDSDAWPDVLMTLA